MLGVLNFAGTIFRRIVLGVLVFSEPALAQTSADNESLRIGVVVPLSGPQAQYGQYIREGLELRRKHLEAPFGVQLIYEDDVCMGQTGVTATKKHIQLNKVHAIYGSWCSSVVLAQAPVAEKAKTLLMASAISPQIKHAGEYIYRIQPDASLYVKALVDYLEKRPELKRWAVLYILNDFGRDQNEILHQLLKPEKGEVVFSESYLPETKDFRPQLLKLRKLKPQVLFLPGYFEVGILMRQARELGIKAQFVGSTPFENEDMLKTAAGAAEGALYPSHFNPDSTKKSVQEYQKLYQERYGRSSEGFAMLAYDALGLYVKLFGECELSASCVKARLDSGEKFNGVTGEFFFDPFGDSVRRIYVRTVKDSRFVTVSR